MNLLDRIKEAGIVGAGGAGFPTHVKLASQAEYLLMNAAECEPLLRVDQQLMAIYPQEIIKGFEMAGRLVGAKEAIIGIKYKHKEVIAILNNKIKELNLGDYIRVEEIKDVYPAGDEQVLVYELTGRVVPEMGIPLNVGCVVINSETALNIYQASLGQNVVDTYITVAGDIEQPVTIKAPVGISIRELLQQAGVQNPDSYRVIDGGPMMGPLLPNLDGYVTKKSKGYILLKQEHPLVGKKSTTKDQAKRMNKASCEQCRMCTDLCPRYLLGHDLQPHKIIRTQAYQLDDYEGQIRAQLCVQCNLCDLFSCPIGIHPMYSNNFYRDQLLSQGRRYQSENKTSSPRSQRDFRLVPSKRLIARLGLYRLDKAAPMDYREIASQEIKIALSQHVGAPAQAVVAVGDFVQKGQLIGAIREGSLGATVHASMDGKVTQIDDCYITIRRN